LRVAAIVLLVLVGAAPLGAQLPRLDDTTRVPRACLGPDGRVPQAPSLVHIVPGPADREYFAPFPAAARPSVRLASEVIARHARTALGAGEGELPALDTTRRSADFVGWVVVIARRDGSMRPVMPWELYPRRERAQWQRLLDDAGAELLADAIDSAAVSDPFMWPEDVKGDSLAFRLRFDWPRPDGRGRFDPIPADYAAPVLPLRVPAVRAARLARPMNFRFRRWPGGGAEDVTVRMEFALDSAGRVLPGTIRDVWPESPSRPTGLAARSYAEFLRDLRRSIEGARFTPARIGTCFVSTPMRQSFLFAYQR
jgi:hypothetical protein